MTHPVKTKIYVGLSGGVDSSVSALLLKQAGYDVHAVFMKNWQGDDDDEYCAASADLADAQAVAARLQIPLHAVNFAEQYWDRVFKHFLQEYKAGRTPNPDILCNKEIKFRAFLDYALAQGADYIATGHYARCIDQDGEQQLWKGLDANKDQSYFLHLLDQSQLAKSLFPIGEMEKSAVRKMAADHHLPNHNKKDSTGICFIGERKFKDFLSEYLLAQPGNIETASGDSIGRHDGLMYYTLGQRQGLHIGGNNQHLELPWYVVDKDIARNVLIIAQGHDHPLLFAQGLSCLNIHWISGKTPELPLQCTAKTRYRQSDQHCLVTIDNKGLTHVMFDKPQRAITPGQSVVFYHGAQCLGGGVIDQVIK